MNEENNFHIRVARNEDAAAISRLLYDAFIPYMPMYTQEAFECTAVNEDAVKKRIAEGVVWVAIRNKRIVGTVAVLQKQEKLYIRGMAVLPDEKGLGTGYKLLEYVEKYAVHNNFKSLILSTTPFLLAAIHLYERSGFTKTSGVNNNFYGTLLFEMEKIL